MSQLFNMETFNGSIKACRPVNELLLHRKRSIDELSRLCIINIEPTHYTQKTKTVNEKLLSTLMQNVRFSIKG